MNERLNLVLYTDVLFQGVEDYTPIVGGYLRDFGQDGTLSGAAEEYQEENGDVGLVLVTADEGHLVAFVHDGEVYPRMGMMGQMVREQVNTTFDSLFPNP